MEQLGDVLPSDSSRVRMVCFVGTAETCSGLKSKKYTPSKTQCAKTDLPKYILYIAHAHGEWRELSLLMSFSPTLKGTTAVSMGGTLIAASLTTSSLPRIPRFAGIHTNVTLLNTRSFSSAHMHSQTRNNSVVVFASAIKAALLPQHICILLFIIFFTQRSYAHLRTASISAENTVRRPPMGMLSF
jgi:hypothetical protein